MKNLVAVFYKHLLVVSMLMMFCAVSAFAQDTVDTSDPGSFIDPNNTNPLLMGVIMLFSYFSGVIPGLKKINVTWIRSAIVAVVSIAGFATFKFGFFTSETVQYIVEGIFPNFAYSGFVYEFIKALLKVFGVEMKSLKAAA